jgi:hypothetical protein
VSISELATIFAKSSWDILAPVAFQDWDWKETKVGSPPRISQQEFRISMDFQDEHHKFSGFVRNFSVTRQSTGHHYPGSEKKMRV